MIINYEGEVGHIIVKSLRNVHRTSSIVISFKMINKNQALIHKFQR